MKKPTLKPITQTQQQQVVGGHIGDTDGPVWKRPDVDGVSKAT